MIQIKPSSMKPNMTGLNHTGLGVSLALPSIERGAFERVFDLAIVWESLADGPVLTLSEGSRMMQALRLNLFT